MRTTRSLDRELSEPTPFYFGVAVLLLAAWGSWLTFAQIPVFSGSTRGRLEVATTTHRAATPSAGRVTLFSVKLGDDVKAQQVLLELDDSVERRRLNEALANVSALDLRLSAARVERRAAEQVRAWQAKAFDAAVAQSRAALAEVSNDLVFRREQADRAERLQREALMSASDALLQAQGLSKTLSQVTSAEAGLTRERLNGQHADQIQVAKIAEVERQIADLEALRVTAVASVGTAEAELSKKVVRAPIAGRVGSVASIQVGDVLDEGAVVASVVPNDPLRIVAEFEPSLAVGRIRTGQTARVRLAGFSLVEFARFDASVTQVASEAQGGTIRVELGIASLLADPRVQHGLPAMVEVCVDKATPWQLVLRALGEAVAPRRYETPMLPDANDGKGSLSVQTSTRPLGT
ncbi:MAG: HlyD family secretion protein [Myxococcota bacterium]